MASSSSSSSTSTKVSGYTFVEQGDVVEKVEVDQYSFGAGSVEVEITHVSLCHTDLSCGQNEWHLSSYPLTPGHEGVGRVVRTGEAVRALKVGDAVAIGWFRSTCYACRACNSGDENLCNVEGSGKGLIMTGPGTFAERVVVDERFAFKVPDSLPLEYTPPLMCAGITVYNPLRRVALDRFGPSAHVGVVGIGGLGHLALKMASKMGFERITAISRSDRKKEAALRLGAHDFIATNNEEQVKANENSFDVILFTASGGKASAFMPLLRAGGRVVQLGLPAGSPTENVDTVQLVPVVFKSIGLIGSGVGGSYLTNEMLAFCAANKVWAEGEVLPIEKLPECIKTMSTEPSKVPFRWIFTTPAAAKYE